MSICVRCGFEYTNIKECERCGADNRKWEDARKKSFFGWVREDLSISIQIILGGLLCISLIVPFIVPFLSPAVAKFILDFPPFHDHRLEFIFQVVRAGFLIFGFIKYGKAIFISMFLSSVFALLISLVVIFGVYVKRFSLREYELLRQVRSDKGPSLTVAAGVLVIISSALSLFFVILLVLLTAISRGENLTFWTSLRDFLNVTIIGTTLPPVLYFLNFPALVLALMFIAVKGYVEKLTEQKVPQPIYMNIDDLAKVAIKSVKKSQNIKVDEPVAIVSMKRTAKGGINLIVSRKEEIEQKDDKGEIITVQKEKRYEVETDERSWIISFKEQSR